MYSDKFIKETLEVLQNSLEETKNSIAYIQSICQHTNHTKVHGANTGHLSEVDDMYWIKHSCNVCGKKWTTYSE